MTDKIERFSINGMVCNNCEKIIEKQAMKINGVRKVSVDYKNQKATVVYDSNKTDIDEITDKIEEKGYLCVLNDEVDIWEKRAKTFTLLGGLLIVIFGGYILAQNYSFFELPEVSQATSLIMLFTVGLFTGFHCIGMCGGFVISYASKEGGWKNHFQYGGGKLLSYTVIGAFFGLIGSIFVFTPMIRGLAAIIAGLFLVLYGLNILNISPRLRRIRLPIPKSITDISAKTKDRGPLAVGLASGLMLACGPLQALYIFAAGTGSVVQGALSLFAFGLGTLPVMLGFGFFTSYVSKGVTVNILKASGMIMLVLGVVMFNRGLALTGTGFDIDSLITASSANSITGAGVATLSGDFQEIRMEVTRYGWEPDKFVLKKGVPVRWMINGVEINGCNNAIVVPKLGLDFDIKYGEQVIEFIPTEEGIISWSCWMGMIPGVFVVEDDLSQGAALLEGIEIPSGSSCGRSCGGICGGSCGCGN